jgi:hypothetical protein
MMPNGDFELNRAWDNDIQSWTKVKEPGSQGGIFVAEGMSEGAYTGVPGYPFDNPNKFMKTNPRGDVSIAAISNSAITPTKADQMLYFDFYVDNPYPFWFIPNSMSRFGVPPEDGTNYTIHSARIDLYDADQLTPPGNFTELAQYLFDPYEANYGGGDVGKKAHVATVLAAEDIASLPNLAAMGFNVPLGQWIGRNLLFVFRYASNVFPLSIGIDNVSIVSCLPLDAKPLGDVLASNGTTPAGNSTGAPAASPVPAGGSAAGTVQPTPAGRKLMTKLHGFGSLYPAQADV